MPEVIYRVDRPCGGGVIEVYGEPQDGWYEWRILDRGAVIRDTRTAGYGAASIALRDALNHDEPPQDGTAIDRAWAQLGALATTLEGTPEGDREASLIHDARDAIAGDGRWPEPADLSDEFKANVATWQYKGNVWGGLHIVKDVSGLIHPMVADYVHLETMHSGGLYGSWAEAFAAYGAALDAWEK